VVVAPSNKMLLEEGSKKSSQIIKVQRKLFINKAVEKAVQ
jgi:hypothetical protein